MKQKLSKKSTDLLDQLVSDAMYHGYMQEEGTGKRVDNAEKVFLLARAALVKRLLYLEKKIVKLKNGT